MEQEEDEVDEYADEERENVVLLLCVLSLPPPPCSPPSFNADDWVMREIEGRVRGGMDAIVTLRVLV